MCECTSDSICFNDRGPRCGEDNKPERQLWPQRCIAQKGLGAKRWRRGWEWKGFQPDYSGPGIATTAVHQLRGCAAPGSGCRNKAVFLKQPQTLQRSFPGRSPSRRFFVSLPHELCWGDSRQADAIIMGFVQKGRPSASFIYDYSRFSIPRVCCTPRPRRVDLSALDDASSQWLKAESPSNFQHRRVYSQIQPDDVLAGYKHEAIAPQCRH